MDSQTDRYEMVRDFQFFLLVLVGSEIYNFSLILGPGPIRSVLDQPIVVSGSQPGIPRDPIPD